MHTPTSEIRDRKSGIQQYRCLTANDNNRLTLRRHGFIFRVLKLLFQTNEK